MPTPLSSGPNKADQRGNCRGRAPMIAARTVAFIFLESWRIKDRDESMKNSLPSTNQPGR